MGVSVRSGGRGALSPDAEPEAAVQQRVRGSSFARHHRDAQLGLGGGRFQAGPTGRRRRLGTERLSARLGRAGCHYCRCEAERGHEAEVRQALYFSLVGDVDEWLNCGLAVVDLETLRRKALGGVWDLLMP